MENILKKIAEFDKVNQTKLAKHEVELGVLQDVQKELVIANTGAIKAIDLAKSALKPAQESLRLNKELVIKFENFTKQIRALGIEGPQKEVENGIVQAKENIKMIETLITNLHSI